MIEKMFVKQGLKKVQLHQYLKKELGRAGFTGFDMVKTPLVTRIIVNVSRPGLAIGKGGQNIRTLTETISKVYGVDNPQLEIKEIPTPDLDAKSVCDKMKNMIERGFAWRSVAFRTVQDIERAGAQGMEVILSGKLAGKGGRKKQVRFIKGYMKKVGDQTKLVDEAKVTTYPKVGAIGVTVRIIRPGVFFPDKVDVKQVFKDRKSVVANETKAVDATTPTTEKTPAVETTPVEAKTETKTEKKPRAKKAKAENTETKEAVAENVTPAHEGGHAA
ncbi:MAG: 30S ribosomal protein S3 [Candidatus Diapherotrites archaeon]|uniref:30S ribosomal protein S3 n=1 Tax=Candidatus Iainarchaeum sp. TaxID=3101447 RepID=A0A8T4C6N0_9ARCH|nr:30S ribosomal protein S3 [Candidatus Diapherotrites archaeon]